MVQFVDAIYASGGTPLGASIRTAGARLAQEASGSQGVIIVLTDGGESCSDNPVDAAAAVFQMTLPRKTSRAKPFAAPVVYADGGDILVHVIGFDIDNPSVEQQLRAIADAGGGKFFSANNSPVQQRSHPDREYRVVILSSRRYNHDASIKEPAATAFLYCCRVVSLYLPQTHPSLGLCPNFA